METQEQLVERQMEREEQQWKLGIERLKDRITKTGVTSNRKLTGDILTNGVLKLIPVIEGHIKAIEEGTVNVHHTPAAIQYLTEFNPEAVSYIAVRECLNAGANRQKLTRTAIRLANLIAEAVEFDEAEQAEPRLMASMNAKAKRWAKTAAKRRILRTAARVAGIQRIGWTEAEKVKLGLKLTELVIEHLGIVVIEEQMDSDRGKDVQRYKQLQLHPDIEEALAKRTEAFGALLPVHLPMLVPPRPWTTPTNGAYLRIRTSLVRRGDKQLRDELLAANCGMAINAVNLIQQTKWRINEDVLAVLNEAWVSGSVIGGLPAQEEDTVPELPKFMRDNPGLKEANMTEDQKKLFTDWKHRARLVHHYNEKLGSQRLAVLNKLAIAKDLKDADEFYFPHSLDFRGRVYPLTADLSPQSDDVSKALIEFAEGRQLGESGGYWLAVHIANLFGEDKLSFDERVAWTQANSDWLVDSGRNPFDGFRFWTQAEEPWCALAACFEWAGFVEEGPAYVSHLPVSMDGTCSGIQHLSALLRDERAAAAVNLVNHERPADIYNEVLEETKRLLSEDSKPLSKVWLDRVDRKIVKRPCMTYAYSVTDVGIRNQIDEEIRKRQDGDYLPGTPNWEAAHHLAPIVKQAIELVVKRPAEAMTWLTQCSKVISKAGLRTEWETPYHLPIRQPYMKRRGKVIKVYFAGEKARHELHTSRNTNAEGATTSSVKDDKRLRVSIQEETNVPDGKKQASSIAPNFIHSLDATHLMRVVNRLDREGITNQYYAMVHDSFGVHAAAVDELQYVIRDEFVKLYSKDILADLYEQFKAQLQDHPKLQAELPLPPKAGDFDIEEVRDADFFFA